jgi:hypothetical protein
MPRSVLSLAVFAALLATPVFGAQPLDGWGGYKFGMSPDAARAVPGQVFGPYSAKNLWNENKGAMGAKKQSMVYGLGWALNLFFDSYEKLNEVSLENERNSSRGDCEKNFLSILGQLEKSYGGFSPVNPQRKRVDTDTPPTSLEWRAQGASGYQFAVVSYEDEYAFVWKARRTVAGNFVDVAATWASKPDDPSAPCITDIDYQGK